MPLQLRDHVHWCDSGGHAVFLDLQSDRYFCLPNAANQAFLRLAAGCAQPGDTDRVQMLVKRRILVDDPASAGIQRPPSVEQLLKDWPREGSRKATVRPILRQSVAEMSAAWQLRTRPLIKVIDTARRIGLNVRPARDPHNPLRNIAGALAAASFILRVQDRCLVRALAVHAICRKRGIRPKLVFGVIAHPFAAHCWVQLGGAVLVGGFEQARLYTPILVIE